MKEARGFERKKKRRMVLKEEEVERKKESSVKHRASMRRTKWKETTKLFAFFLSAVSLIAVSPEESVQRGQNCAGGNLLGPSAKIATGESFVCVIL